MKILVIQQKLIGDVLISTVVLEALATNYPDAELHYLINSYTRPIIENNPFVQKVQLFTPEMANSNRAFYAFIKRIRKENYDIVIDAYGKWSSTIISFFSKAPVRISYYKFYTFFFYTKTTKLLKAPRHHQRLAIENRLALLSPLGIPFHPYAPGLYVTTKEKKAGQALLTGAGIDVKRPLIMIGLLGSTPNKSYPPSYMIAVLEYVIKKIPDVQLVLNYAPAQKQEANNILKRCKADCKKHIFNQVYADNLRMFMSITTHCNAFIGNEGGAANMSKALSVPVFAIFSPIIGKQGWFNESEKPKNYAVHIADFITWTKKEERRAKKDPLPYYQKLTPEKIMPELDAFLENII